MTRSMCNKITEHINKAYLKHPLFVDRLPAKTPQAAEANLALCREQLARKKELLLVEPDDLLTCEMAEVWEAYAKGDIDNAIDEVFDAIAVLVRLVARLVAEKEEVTK